MINHSTGFLCPFPIILSILWKIPFRKSGTLYKYIHEISMHACTHTHTHTDNALYLNKICIISMWTDISCNTKHLHKIFSSWTDPILLDLSLDCTSNIMTILEGQYKNLLFIPWHFSSCSMGRQNQNVYKLLRSQHPQVCKSTISMSTKKLIISWSSQINRNQHKNNPPYLRHKFLCQIWMK